MGWFDDNPYGMVGGGISGGMDFSGGFAQAQPGGAHTMDERNIGGVTSNGVPVSTAGPVASAKLGDSGGANFGNLSDPNAWMGLVGNDAQLTQWVQQQNPGLSPDLVQYYVGKIKGQPGANPTEQAGSANYWADKLKADPTTGGGGQNGGPVTVGGVPGIDPSYGFRFNQGLDALQKSAASRGTLLTGGTLKGITNYGQNAASQEYGADFGRQFGIAQLGENAAANTGSLGANYSGQIGSQYANIGNAQSAGTVGVGNAIGSGVNGALNGYQMNQSSYNPYSFNSLSGGR
jgi:hypothetical protein